MNLREIPILANRRVRQSWVGPSNAGDRVLHIDTAFMKIGSFSANLGVFTFSKNYYINLREITILANRRVWRSGVGPSYAGDRVLHIDIAFMKIAFWSANPSVITFSKNYCILINRYLMFNLAYFVQIGLLCSNWFHGR